MKRRSSEDPQGNEAVVLLGHGSRVPTAGQAMEQVAARLRELGTFALVEVCHMSMQEPTLADALETCAKEGASKVVIVPYFLHEGAHIREDIPGMLREKAAEYPDMTLILGKHLGYDESLVDLVERRAMESLASSDVRCGLSR